MTEKRSGSAPWRHCALALLLLGGLAACAGLQSQASAPAASSEAAATAVYERQQAMAPAYFVPTLEARPAVNSTGGRAWQAASYLPPRPGVGEGRPLFPYQPEAPEGPGLEVRLGEIAREVAGKVFYQLRQDEKALADIRLAVVQAVPLADLKRESEFGRVLAEFFLTDLADRGLRVQELRLGRDIHIIPQTGEFVLSRNVGELASDQQALDYVLLSTFSNTRQTLMLHGRLVGLQDGLVRTSWRHTLPLDRELRALFGKPAEPYSIAIRGMM